MYEHRSDPILPRRRFVRRLWLHFQYALGLVVFSLFIGTAGYRLFADFSWLDSFLNASMLLGGMGPVGEIRTNGGKVFASLYALYAGLVLIAASGILLTPVLHRVLHRLHLEGGRTRS
jgi:hypothetical protein